MKDSIILVSFLLYHLQVAYPSGIVELKFLTYKNPGGRLASGSCCEGRFLCIRECDNFFVICLSQDRYVKMKSGTPNCNIGSSTSDHIPENDDITFGNSIGSNLSNPVRYGFNQWQGKLNIRIQVRDYDIFSKSDLVDNLYKSMTPTVNSRKLYSQWTTTFLSGMVSTLRIQVRVYCNPGYFAPDCFSVKCIPHDDTSGHYTCSTSGDKICRPFWYGKECTVYCRDVIGKYKCDPVKGTKICSDEWSGKECNEYISSSSGALYTTLSTSMITSEPRKKTSTTTTTQPLVTSLTDLTITIKQMHTSTIGQVVIGTHSTRNLNSTFRRTWPSLSSSTSKDFISPVNTLSPNNLDRSLSYLRTPGITTAVRIGHTESSVIQPKSISSTIILALDKKSQYKLSNVLTSSEMHSAVKSTSYNTRTVAPTPYSVTSNIHPTTSSTVSVIHPTTSSTVSVIHPTTSSTVSVIHPTTSSTVSVIHPTTSSTVSVIHPTTSSTVSVIHPTTSSTVSVIHPTTLSVASNSYPTTSSVAALENTFKTKCRESAGRKTYLISSSPAKWVTSVEASLSSLCGSSINSSWSSTIVLLTGHNNRTSRTHTSRIIEIRGNAKSMAISSSELALTSVGIIAGVSLFLALILYLRNRKRTKLIPLRNKLILHEEPGTREHIALIVEPYKMPWMKLQNDGYTHET